MSTKQIEGKKLDAGKEPVTQGLFDYFPRALLAVAGVSQYGATKYDVPYEDENWRRVPNGIPRYRDAVGRHILKEKIDGPIDPESKKLHAAHAAWNALATLELRLTEQESKAPAIKPPVSKGRTVQVVNLSGEGLGLSPRRDLAGGKLYYIDEVRTKFDHQDVYLVDVTDSVDKRRLKYTNGTKLA